MKYLLIFAGFIFILKGAAKSYALVNSFSVSSITSAYAEGLLTGQSIVALAFVVCGVALIKRGRAVAMTKPRAA